MLSIWLTYAILSQAVAYWSISPSTGPRLWCISQAYTEHMHGLPWFMQVSRMAPTQRHNEIFDRASPVS
jgi:hypothetical protein